MWICNCDKGEYFKGIVRFSTRTDGLVAQSVEHRPFKAVVPGSNPGQLTIFFVFISRIYTMNRGRIQLPASGSPGSEVHK